MVDLVPPSRWSAEPWRYERMLGEDTASLMDGWAVHWPGSRTSTFADPTFAETVARLLSWERFHTDPPPDGRGWRGLAYDYAIDLAGRAFRIRGTGQSGATSGDYDEDGVPNNRETDAILLVLGAADVPSPQMLATFAALVDQLGGPRDYIIGHRQARGTSTSCPGDHAMRHVVTPAQDWDSFAADHTTGLTMADVDDIMARLDEIEKRLDPDALAAAAAKGAYQQRTNIGGLESSIEDPVTDKQVQLHTLLRRTRFDGHRITGLLSALAADNDRILAAIADAEGLTVDEVRAVLAQAVEGLTVTFEE